MNAPVVATDAPILSMVDIVKTFGRVAAVDQVSIDVKPGKIEPRPTWARTAPASRR